MFFRNGGFYENGGGVKIEENEWIALLKEQMMGKKIVADKNGFPIAVPQNYTKNASGDWVLDIEKELLAAKQAKRLEIEQAFNSARNGAFPIQINDNQTGSMLIPAGNPGNDAIIDWCKKTSATKALEPSAYVFVPYTKENETTALRTTFSSDAEVKPVFITAFGVLKYGKDGNKIKAKTIYTRIDYLNKAALTLLLSSIEKMKISDSNYRRELLLALDNATDINAVNSIVVKTKRLNDNSLMNIGFTPTLYIENGLVILNTTGLDVEI